MAILRVCLLISAISMVTVYSQAPPALCPNTAGSTRLCPRLCSRTSKCEFGICTNCNLENISQSVGDQQMLNDLLAKSQIELPVEDWCNNACPKVEEILSEYSRRISLAFRYNGICTCSTLIQTAVPVVAG